MGVLTRSQHKDKLTAATGNVKLIIHRETESTRKAQQTYLLLLVGNELTATINRKTLSEIKRDLHIG